MPSNSMRLFGLATTAGLFIAGAWLAQEASSDETIAAVAQMDRDYYAEQAQSASVAPATAGPLVVTLDGIRNSRGKVLVLAFDNESAFDASDFERAAGYKELPAKSGTMQVRFPKLKSGDYAVIAIHDENGNYALDYGSATPTEGVTVSNSWGSLDSPGFWRAKVTAGPIDMRMYYYN